MSAEEGCPRFFDVRELFISKLQGTGEEFFGRLNWPMKSEVDLQGFIYAKTYKPRRLSVAAIDHPM